jgi:hypothetical protein
MKFVQISSLLLLATQAAAHGLITRIKGANGVEMPGLTGNSIVEPSTFRHWLMVGSQLLMERDATAPLLCAEGRKIPQ